MKFERKAYVCIKVAIFFSLQRSSPAIAIVSSKLRFIVSNSPPFKQKQQITANFNFHCFSFNSPFQPHWPQLLDYVVMLYYYHLFQFVLHYAHIYIYVCIYVSVYVYVIFYKAQCYLCLHIVLHFFHILKVHLDVLRKMSSLQTTFNNHNIIHNDTSFYLLCNIA